jgi:uncharacterized membrane protein YeiH
VEIPVVLRREIYAVAALLGAALVATLTALHVNRTQTILLASVLVFVLRLVALRRNWSAPIAGE